MSEKREITAKELEQIEELAGLGLSLTKISCFLGMHRNHLRDITKKNDAVYSAMVRGQAKAEMEIQRTAFEMAKSGKYPHMTMGWLKLRAYYEQLEAKKGANFFDDMMHLIS